MKMKNLVEELYAAQVQLELLTRIKKRDKISETTIKGILSKPDENSAEDFIALLIAGKVFEFENEKSFFTPGSAWEDFVNEIEKYTNIDAILCRNLGLSRQAFDELCRWYGDAIKGKKSLDEILKESFEDYDDHDKASMITGILLQRSIDESIMNDIKNRSVNLARYAEDLYKRLKLLTEPGEE
jgi:hypothetical protein